MSPEQVVKTALIEPEADLEHLEYVLVHEPTSGRPGG